MIFESFPHEDVFANDSDDLAQGYGQCVRLLLEWGAATEMLSGGLRMSALHLAAQVRYLSSLNVLRLCLFTTWY